MSTCHVVEVVTPKRFILNGLWFGGARPKRVIVWVHGMFSSAFSMTRVVEALANKDTAVLTFNNRGYEVVSEVNQRISATKKRWVRAGTAHEVFADCVDDIQGAVDFVRTTGVKQVFLAGHSTGCQKIVYWTAKTGGKGTRGLILIAPLSDYAGESAKTARASVVTLAKRMVKAGKGRQLLPPGSWWHYADAERFLSLYTPDSVEQSIFPYFDEKRSSKSFSSIKLSIIALFAGEDEFADRPAERLVDWFKMHAKSKSFQALIVPGVGHGFRGGEERVIRAIRMWIKQNE